MKSRKVGIVSRIASLSFHSHIWVERAPVQKKQGAKSLRAASGTINLI